MSLFFLDRLGHFRVEAPGESKSHIEASCQHKNYLENITSIDGNGAEFLESPNLRRPRIKRISTPGFQYMKS